MAIESCYCCICSFTSFISPLTFMFSFHLSLGLSSELYSSHKLNARNLWHHYNLFLKFWWICYDLFIKFFDLQRLWFHRIWNYSSTSRCSGFNEPFWFGWSVPQSWKGETSIACNSRGLVRCTWQITYLHRFLVLIQTEMVFLPPITIANFQKDLANLQAYVLKKILIHLVQKC